MCSDYLLTKCVLEDGFKEGCHKNFASTKIFVTEFTVKEVTENKVVIFHSAKYNLLWITIYSFSVSNGTNLDA